MSTQQLYTPAMLAAAVELANYPRLEEAPLHGTARSASCGSSLELDLVLNPQVQVTMTGMTVRACAVGQSAAAIFARHVAGRDAADIASTHDQLLDWLDGGAMPDWPDFSLISPALEYRGRHGAILLPWKAALSALSRVPASG